MNIGPFLEATAKAQKLVTYQQVVDAFPTLPPLGPYWPAHPLSGIFGTLDQEDADKKRPFRTSVVVNKAHGMPGDGFFEALEQFKGIPCGNSESERLSVWIAELKAAHAFKWP